MHILHSCIFCVHIKHTYSGAPHIPPGQRSSGSRFLGLGILVVGWLLVGWLLVVGGLFVVAWWVVEVELGKSTC